MLNLDVEWTKWSTEWISRRKLFKQFVPVSLLFISTHRTLADYVSLYLIIHFSCSLWCLNLDDRRIWSTVTDALSAQDAIELMETIGIEADGAEHLALEKSALFAANSKVGKSHGKGRA